MVYRYHAKRWIRTFPVTIGCAIFSIILLIKPSLIPVEYLKTYYFNEPSGMSILAPALILFAYQAVALIRRQIKIKKQYTNNGKISYKFFLEELHIPIFYGIDQTAILCLNMGLFLMALPQAATPAYHQIHIFENFADIVVIPFISLINYYCKVLREESTPNFIINHFK